MIKQFIQWAARWHIAFLLLLAGLALHASATMGVYVVSDDLAWVQRAAADARAPWNAFVKPPVFGDYYRPIPELVWTLNYRLWGFDFDGYQLTYIMMWLAGVCAVYAVGCRLGGRIAGFAAAAIIGLNDVYLLISSWKSWTTTVVEYIAVLACVWAMLKWLEERRPRYAIATAILVAIATLSREMAPLVLSAAAFFALVLPGFKPAAGERPKRAARWLIVWAVVTCGVLLALPTYRNSALKLLNQAPAPAAAAAADKPPSGASFIWTRFVGHTRSMFGMSVPGRWFGWGISRYLVWFAAVFSVLRARRARPALERRYHRVLIGAFLLGAVVLAAPWAVGAAGQKAQNFSMESLEPAVAAGLLLLFCAAAFAGDRLDRMLGAWFVASFVPVLFLEHTSNAYHLLALTALALFTARALPGFVRDELLPAAARLWNGAPAEADDDARYVLVAVFTSLIFIQAVMLRTNVRLSDPVIQQRAKDGRAMEAYMDRAIAGVVKAAGATQQVWVAPKPYAELAGLMLQEKYGFNVRRLDHAANDSDPAPIYLKNPSLR